MSRNSPTEHHGWPTIKVRILHPPEERKSQKETESSLPLEIKKEKDEEWPSFDFDSTEDNLPSWNCTVCGKDLLNKHSFKLHMKAHLGQLDHRCSDCKKTFYNKEDLKSHVASVHEKQKRFNCQICGNSFTHRRSLRVHLQRVHVTDWRDVAHNKISVKGPVNQ